jgi:hypothetical protein
MFIRRTKGGSKEKPVYYLQLVHSYRDCNGKPRHKIICNLGREEELLNKAVFDDLVKKFSQFAKKWVVSTFLYKFFIERQIRMHLAYFCMSPAHLHFLRLMPVASNKMSLPQLFP